MKRITDGKVYLVTCHPTKKQYVGQTQRDMEVRMQHHFQLSRKLTHYPMYADMCKFPESDFSYEILHRGITDKAELNRLEKLEMEQRGTLVPSGYNQPHTDRYVYPTGEAHHRYGVPHTKASKAKMAKAKRGRKHSPETIEKIRASVRKHHASNTRPSNTRRTQDHFKGSAD